MNRNQKIAIGCCGAGCLILIFFVIVGAAMFFLMSRSPAAGIRTTNVNRGSSRNSNSNSSFESDSNSDSNSSSEGEGKSSMSDDDRHKLFQAGTATQDTELAQRVWKKLGLVKSDGSPNDTYPEFVKDHVVWLISNTDFATSINTPEKARAYVEAHIND